METGTEVRVSNVSNPEYEIYSKTPEIYLGQARYNGEQYVKLEGDWVDNEEFVNPQKGSKLYLNFDSKEVFLVMRSKQSSAKVKVYLDDKVHYLGEDNINGVVTVDRDRLYKLIKLDIPGKHLLRLEFEDNNVEIYAFTFGWDNFELGN